MDIRDRLNIAGVRLSNIESSDSDTTGPVGFLIGALYALGLAWKYNYLVGDLLDDEYKVELESVANALAELESPELVVGTRGFPDGEVELPSAWIGGFYFNSALHRLAAGAERLGVHVKENSRHDEPKLVGTVRREVNNLKHKRSGLVGGREIKSIESALEVLEMLVETASEDGLLNVQ